MKVQHTGSRRELLQSGEGHHQESTASSILDGGGRSAFLLRLEPEEECLLSLLLVDIALKTQQTQ